MQGEEINGVWWMLLHYSLPVNPVCEMIHLTKKNPKIRRCKICYVSSSILSALKVFHQSSEELELKPTKLRTLSLVFMTHLL